MDYDGENIEERAMTHTALAGLDAGSPPQDLETIALRAARTMLHAVPWSDMSARMIEGANPEILDERAQILTLRETIFKGPSGETINAILTALATAARDQGLAGPVENAWDSPTLDAWNAFMAGRDDAAIEGPVAIMRGMMISEMVWAANPSRHRKGSESPRHTEAEINHDLFWSRMQEVTPNLTKALATGTSESWHDGAREALSVRATRRIRLEGWTPTVQERTGVTRPWSDPLLAPKPEMDDDLSLEI